MLKAATAKIIPLNIITTTVRNNFFNHSHLKLSLSYILYSASSVPKPENIFVCFSRGKRYMPDWQMYLLAGARLRYRKKSGAFCRKSLCCNGLRRGSRYPLKVSRILPVWHMGRLA
jgi:hypothetical protein